ACAGSFPPLKGWAGSGQPAKAGFVVQKGILMPFRQSEKGMSILHFTLGPMDNNTYLIVDDATGEAALVDPSFDADALLPEITTNGRTLRYILNTHAHFDHIVGNAFFAKETE